MLSDFFNLKQLILDYNQMKTLDSLPFLPGLKVISLSYNQLNNETQLLQKLS